MILTAHQPVYLPWLGLFHKINISDNYVSLNGVQYTTNDWVNRNKILSAQGPMWLTVPVLISGHMKKTIREIEINNQVPWQSKHWKSISMNYKKCKFFNEYAEHLESVYMEKQWKYLVDLNEYMLKWFLQKLGIGTKFVSQNEYVFSGHKSELISGMCAKLGADVFIFGGQGKNYADLAAFQAVGVRPYFQEYSHPEYKQRYEGFHPNLSIIDLLFNCGPSSLEILMSGNLAKAQLLSGVPA